MKFREASILALSPELATIPIRSPETSIILAEVARRQREAAEQKRPTNPVQAFFARLVSDWRLENPITSANVSVVLTVNGPLVYQW
jgi:hypothetical protein